MNNFKVGKMDEGPVKFEKLFVFLFLAVVLVLFLRLMIVIRSLGRVAIRGKKSSQNVKTLLVAGSGGHTAEILRLLNSLSGKYTPRIYVLADTDRRSKDKILELEKTKYGNDKEFTLVEIPRSREVRQSYFTSIATTIKATLYAIPVVCKHLPDLIIVNGPGTCIPVCAVAFLLRVLGIKQVLQIYVESVCRVESLSLSGLIMYYFADKILVQWPQLKHKYPRTEYLGRVL